jgi:two-component system, OmpR family, response regulator
MTDADALAVLVVEDDAALAGSLNAELSARGYRVDVASNARAGLARISETPYDAVVLDRMLPGMDGVDLLKRVREAGVDTPAIMLTALGRTPERVEGLAAGADDYVVKPFEIDELDARLKAVLRRHSRSKPDDSVVTAGDVVVSIVRHQAVRAGVAIELQKTELRLLAELVREAGNVLTRPMLLERVWGYDFTPTTNIVDACILRLRQRIALPGLPDPIVTVRGVGYMFKP